MISTLQDRMEGYRSLYQLMQASTPVDKGEWTAICMDVANLLRAEVQNLSSSDWDGFMRCIRLSNGFMRLSRKACAKEAAA